MPWRAALILLRTAVDSEGLGVWTYTSTPTAGRPGGVWTYTSTLATLGCTRLLSESQFGNTPIRYAVREGHAAVVAQFLADPRVAMDLHDGAAVSRPSLHGFLCASGLGIDIVRFRSRQLSPESHSTSCGCVLPPANVGSC